MHEVCGDVTSLVTTITCHTTFCVLPLQVAKILSTATSQPEVLQADAVSETTEVIETVLTDAAITDPMVYVQKITRSLEVATTGTCIMTSCLVQVAEQYLNIIDNIQQVNETVVRESEGDTGVSMRLMYCMSVIVCIHCKLCRSISL